MHLKILPKNLPIISFRTKIIGLLNINNKLFLYRWFIVTPLFYKNTRFFWLMKLLARIQQTYIVYYNSHSTGMEWKLYGTDMCPIFHFESFSWSYARFIYLKHETHSCVYLTGTRKIVNHIICFIDINLIFGFISFIPFAWTLLLKSLNIDWYVHIYKTGV